MRRALAAVLGIGLAAATLQVRAQEDGGYPNTRRLGRAIVQYRNRDLQIVLNYEYSQRHHDLPWLLIDFGARSERRLVLDREHFKLVSQAGDWFPVASQQHFLEAGEYIRSIRQNSSVWRRDLGTYLGALDRRESLKFFAAPGEGVVITGALLDKDRNTFGELYFEMPRGAWDKGDYALLIEHPYARLKLPISLD